MIEGRTDTADAILESDIIASYNFKGEQRGRCREASFLQRTSKGTQYSLKEAQIVNQ